MTWWKVTFLWKIQNADFEQQCFFICSDAVTTAELGEGKGAEDETVNVTMQQPQLPAQDMESTDSVMVNTPGIGLSNPGHNNLAWNRQQAVSVRHAFKTYGSSKNPNHVIQNLNMTVAKGSM